MVIQRRWTIVPAVLALIGALACASFAADGTTSSAPAPTPATTTPAGPTSTPAPAIMPATSPAPTPAATEWVDPRADLPPRQYVIGSLESQKNAEGKPQGYLLQAVLDSRGSAIYTVKLADYYMTAHDKRLAGKLKSETAYEEAIAKEPPASPAWNRGHYSLLNPVSDDKGRWTYLPLATTFVWVEGVKKPFLPDTSWEFVKQETAPDGESESITFAWTLGKGTPGVPLTRDGEYVRLEKTYTVHKRDYSIGVSLTVFNRRQDQRKQFDELKVKFAQDLEGLAGALEKLDLSDAQRAKVKELLAPARAAAADQKAKAFADAFEKIRKEVLDSLKITIDQAGPTGVPDEPYQRDSRQAVFARQDKADKTVDFKYKGEGDLKAIKLEEGQAANQEQMGTSNEAKPITWIGHTNKYFAAILHPDIPAAGNRPFDAADFYLAAANESPYTRTWLTGVRFPDIKLAADGSYAISFDLFAGPKDRDMLDGDPDALGKPLYKDLGYIKTVDVIGGGCCGMTWCTFGWLTTVMMWLLKFFASYATFGNYGVAIMILVVLVRLVLHPLTKKGQVSMARMQKLAPMVAKLKEKYADDKETLNKEMMKMYKQQGPAQIMGCLPMFLQMPVWIALWTALNNAIELRQAPFLPVWITDLSGPDAIFTWAKPIDLPLFGAIFSFNLLPILMIVAMVLQTKLTQTTAATATPDQIRTQKMMMYMMPVMMLIFLYNAASGLNLYIMVSSFAGAAEQYVIRKHIREKEAAEAATTVMIEAPGKGPRGGRPKKPKGPFWMKRG